MEGLDAEHMAEPGQVYDRIKSRLLAHMPAPMQLLQISSLADELGTSTTPVREALTRLAAEKVIVYLPKKGFFSKALNEDELRGLYVVNQTLLHASHNKSSDTLLPMDPARRALLNSVPNAEPAVVHAVQGLSAGASDAEQRVELTATLFSQIAIRSGNSVVADIVSNINDRLHHARMVEQEVIVDAREELMHIYDLHHANLQRQTLHAIVSYHEKRLQLLSLICKELLFRPFSASARQRESRS